MRIVWDEPKRIANRDKHGLDFADLTENFFDESLVISAANGRWKAIGRFGMARSRSCSSCSEARGFP